MAGSSYRGLDAWQEGMNLVEDVYRATRNWPRDELYGLTNQVRRAVVSVPANVAEGQGRGSPREFMHFVNVADGSLHEVETHLLISRRLQYIDDATLESLLDRAAHVGRLLHGLLRHLQSQAGQSD